jgi:hypothetical protein
MHNVCLDVHHSKRVNKTVIVSDIGDYSLFINKDITGADLVFLKSKKSFGWIRVVDYLASSSGSVLYFNKNIKSLFKENCIYPINLRVPMSIMDMRKRRRKLYNLIRRFSYYGKQSNANEIAYHLYDGGYISTEEYLKRVFI